MDYSPIKQLIRQGDLLNALLETDMTLKKTQFEIKKKIFNLHARLNNILDKVQKGIIDSSEEQLEVNSIRVSLIDIIFDLENPKPDLQKIKKKRRIVLSLFLMLIIALSGRLVWMYYTKDLVKIRIDPFLFITEDDSYFTVADLQLLSNKKQKVQIAKLEVNLLGKSDFMVGQFKMSDPLYAPNVGPQDLSLDRGLSGVFHGEAISLNSMVVGESKDYKLSFPLIKDELKRIALVFPEREQFMGMHVIVSVTVTDIYGKEYESNPIELVSINQEFYDSRIIAYLPESIEINQSMSTFEDDPKGKTIAFIKQSLSERAHSTLDTNAVDSLLNSFRTDPSIARLQAEETLRYRKILKEHFSDKELEDSIDGKNAMRFFSSLRP